MLLGNMLLTTSTIRTWPPIWRNTMETNALTKGSVCAIIFHTSLEPACSQSNLWLSTTNVCFFLLQGTGRLIPSMVWQDITAVVTASIQHTCCGIESHCYSLCEGSHCSCSADGSFADHQASKLTKPSLLCRNSETRCACNIQLANFGPQEEANHPP